jgi:MFS family permease
VSVPRRPDRVATARGEDRPSIDDPGTSSFASLRIPRFRRLWLAIMIFNVGHLVLVVASSWLILEITGSPLWVSAMVGAPTLPLLFLALPSGAAADLLDRRILLLVASLVMAVAAVGMAVMSGLGAASPAAFVGLGLLLGVGVAIFNPAWQAIVPALVPQSLLPGAIALNSASGGIATALGPALGGLAVATLGSGWSFVLAAVGYFTIFGTVMSARGLEWENEKDSMGVAIATGIRYLRFSDGYLRLLLLGCLFGFWSAALRAMLPNVTSDALGGSADLYGVLLGAFGAGAIVGGLSRSTGVRLFGDRIVPASIMLFGAAGILVGAIPTVWVVLVCVAVAGLLWTWILATLNSIFQMLTPDWVRGRTMSAFILSIFGFLPLGAVAAGQVGEAIGAAASLVAFSGGVMLTGIIAFRMRLPVLENIRPPVLPTDRENWPAGRADADQSQPVMVVSTWTVEESELAEFTTLLADLRRLRLTTGAYQWGAYRSASRTNSISEVFMVHSWEHHIQQLRRLDTDGLAILERAERFDRTDDQRVDHLIAFDVDPGRSRPGRNGRKDAP